MVTLSESYCFIACKLREVFNFVPFCTLVDEINIKTWPTRNVTHALPGSVLFPVFLDMQYCAKAEVDKTDVRVVT
jgi:hypothetical protein